EKLLVFIAFISADEPTLLIEFVACTLFLSVVKHIFDDPVTMRLPVYYLSFPIVPNVPEFIVAVYFNGKFVFSIPVGYPLAATPVPEITDLYPFIAIRYFQ